MTTLTLFTHGTPFLTIRQELEPTTGPLIAALLADLSTMGIPVELETKGEVPSWTPNHDTIKIL